MVALARSLNALVVDDDSGVRLAVSAVLNAAGHRAVPARSKDEAVQIVRVEPVHFCIVDIHVRAESGLQIVGSLRGFVSTLPVIFMSGAFTPEIIGRARALGAHHCLEKPLDMWLLREAVNQLILTERLFNS